MREIKTKIETGTVTAIFLHFFIDHIIMYLCPQLNVFLSLTVFGIPMMIYVDTMDTAPSFFILYKYHCSLKIPPIWPHL